MSQIYDMELPLDVTLLAISQRETLFDHHVPTQQCWGSAHVSKIKTVRARSRSPK